MPLEQHRLLRASLIFDLTDRYALERGLRSGEARPIGPITYRLVGQVIGGVRQALRPNLELIVQRSPSGFDLFFDSVRLPDNSLRQNIVADGRYVVQITSNFYQAVEQEVVLATGEQPGPPIAIGLEPGFYYPFPNTLPLRLEEPLPGGCTENQQRRRGHGPTLLRGTLFRPGGAGGWGGATVQVAAQSNLYRTDSSGQWVLWFSPDQLSGPVTVHFVLPGGRAEDVTQVCLIQGRACSLQQAALRGFVLMNNGQAVRNATVKISGQPLTTTTGPDGSWFYYFALNEPGQQVNVTVELPGGGSATQNNILVRPRATVTVPTFRFV